MTTTTIKKKHITRPSSTWLWNMYDLEWDGMDLLYKGEVLPTKKDALALEQAREEYKKGEYVTLDQLKKTLLCI